MNSSRNMNVTVIVITYNSANTIVETLDSIMEQTYKDIELIVSDDSSKDDTLILVEQWMKEKKTRFINTKLITSLHNTGVAENCNRGVNASTTEYYKIIAGDDILENNAIQSYVEFICANPNAVGVSKITPFGTVGQSKINMWGTVFEKGYEILQYPIKKKYRRLVIRNFVCAAAVGLIKKEWYYQINGFSKEYPFYEDHPMYIKLMEHGHDFMLIDNFLARYRVSDNALCGGNSPLVVGSAIKYFRKEKMWKLLKCGGIIELVMQSFYFFLLWIKYKYK